MEEWHLKQASKDKTPRTEYFRKDIVSKGSSVLKVQRPKECAFLHLLALGEKKSTRMARASSHGGMLSERSLG